MLIVLQIVKCRVVLMVSTTTFVMVLFIMKVMLFECAIVIEIRHLNGIALVVVVIAAHGKLTTLLDHALHSLEVGRVIKTIPVVLLLDLTNTSTDAVLPLQ